MRYFLLIFLAIVAVVAGIAGRRGDRSRKPPIEIIPDMNRQFKLRPETEDKFFTDDHTSQLPPSGTVARSQPIQTDSGPVYTYEKTPLTTGCVTGTTNFVATNPLPITPSFLRRGREQFQIFCTPCHGPLGDGNGITKKLGDMPAVVSLHSKRIVEMPDGELFHIITYGKSLMAAYGPTVSVRDRWAIVAYLRALQLSQLGSTNDLPPTLLAKLKK